MLLNRITNFFYFCYKKIEAKSNRQIYILNELQWLGICASGNQSDRLLDIVSDRPALTYLKIIIIYEMLKLHFFFYKNQVYKNVRLEILKNLRTC